MHIFVETGSIYGT